jgi:signal transduction histidine kinase
MDSTSAEINISPIDDIFANGGEMGQLMRSMDWSSTPLGPIENWPQSLRTTVSICLASRFPMLIWWGPELVMLYNDAYRPILGSTKHPKSMGQRGKECWREIWNIIGPMLEGVIQAGNATWSVNQMLPLERNGYAEECYFTFSYSPIRDESGGIGGVFTAVTETTGQVLSERRLRTLHDLAEFSAEAKTAGEACTIAADTLAKNAADIPFALLYLLTNDGNGLHLAGSFGLTPNTPLSATEVDLTVEHDGSRPWPLAQVAHTQESAFVDGLAPYARFFSVDVAEPRPQSALVLPISRPGQSQSTPYGLLVAGISPMRTLDADYRNFFELIAEQIATAIGKANAYNEARERAEALAELDRAKTTFFSNVSHEFRTPLTLLLGPIEDALADTVHPLQPPQRERLQIVRRNSLRLLKLVNTLLDFSRIEAGRSQALYEPTDLAAFTADLASVFRSAMEQAGLQLVIDCAPLPEPVYVDRDMWEKIVLNLLSNAFKFTFTGQVTVSLRQADHADNTVQLQVSDTGTGIPQEEVLHLFERFHRVRGTKARTHEGSGIGLALIYELVKLHGGNIQVASTAGEGTTFTVTILLGTSHLPAERIGTERTWQSIAISAAPFIEDALRWLPTNGERANLISETVIPDLEQSGLFRDRPVGQTKTISSRTASAHVLLADDNADMRDYVRRLLSTSYSVEAVANGTDALNAAVARKPDLVITDIMMPELDGFQLLQALRADVRTRSVPVILLSARAGEEAAIEGLSAGANDYLVKPFSARELLARVKSHLEIVRIRDAATLRIRQHTDHLQKLAQAALQINSTFSAEEILWLITDQARAIIGTHQGITSRVLLSNWAQAIHAVSLSNTYADWREADIHIDGYGIYAVVCDKNRPVRLSQFELERHADWLGFKKELTQRPPMRGWLAAPLIGRDGENLGLIQLSDKYDGSDFTEEDEAILVQLAQMASIAIENAQLYQQAQDAIHGRDELLSLVSHDLKNPVGTIKGYAQLLGRMVKRANALNREQLIDGLARIDETSTKMTILINELLGLSRLQMGQQLELDLQPTDIIALAQQAVTAQQQTTERHTIILNTNLPMLIGQWDTPHLERVFANLLTNAIKYSPDGGTILVEISQQEIEAAPHAVVSIQDSGLGIPAADLPHIFEQFHRAANVARSIKGTGIGLSSAYQIIKQHCGNITVESTEGRGSTFTVCLPLSVE